MYHLGFLEFTLFYLQKNVAILLQYVVVEPLRRQPPRFNSVSVTLTFSIPLSYLNNKNVMMTVILVGNDII